MAHAGLARAAVREQQTVARLLGLDEEPGESGMRLVVHRVLQHHLEHARDLDPARSGTGIAERDRTALGGALGVHPHFHPGIDAALEPRDRHRAVGVVRVVAVGLPRHRAQAQGPEGPVGFVSHVAKVDEPAVGILDRIAAPRGERLTVEPRSPAPGGGDERAQGAASEQPGRGADAPGSSWIRRRDAGGCGRGDRFTGIAVAAGGAGSGHQRSRTSVRSTEWPPASRRQR
jgi:hypothetical protein